MLHTYSLTFVFSQDGRKAPTTLLWYHVSRNRFCDCLRTLEHVERWIPRSHFPTRHLENTKWSRAGEHPQGDGAREPRKRKMIRSLFQLRIFRILAIIFSYIPGTRNIPFKVVVSIKWFQTFTNGKWLEITKHPLKYGCLGFQVYIYIIYISIHLQKSKFHAHFVWKTSPTEFPGVPNNILRLESALKRHHQGWSLLGGNPGGISERENSGSKGCDPRIPPKNPQEKQLLNISKFEKKI